MSSKEHTMTLIKQVQSKVYLLMMVKMSIQVIWMMRTMMFQVKITMKKIIATLVKIKFITMR
jgi:hypothetical protein